LDRTPEGLFKEKGCQMVVFHCERGPGGEGKTGNTPFSPNKMTEEKQGRGGKNKSSQNPE